MGSPELDFAAPPRLIVNASVRTGHRSRVGPPDRREEETRPRAVGQLAGGARARGEWSDFDTEGALVPGPAHSHPLVRPGADRGLFWSLPSAVARYTPSEALSRPFSFRRNWRRL